MSTLWKVEREWDGQTVAVLASGPSMTYEVARKVSASGIRSIAVNNQGIDCTDAKGQFWKAMSPDADILFAADRIWWKNNYEAAENFKGRLVTVAGTNGDLIPFVERTLVLGNSGVNGFDHRKDYIRTGRNSGYAAVHLAAHLGAKRILLCGFDMHDNCGQHWFNDHAFRKGHHSRFEFFIGHFNSVAHEYVMRNIEVINCTKDSALKCFVYMPLEEALHHAVFSMRKSSAYNTEQKNSTEVA